MTVASTTVPGDELATKNAVPRRPTRSGSPASSARTMPARRTLVTLGLELSVVGVTAMSLDTLLTPGRWLPLALAACLVLGLVTAALRSRLRSTWSPTALAALLAGYAFTVIYASPPGRTSFLPDDGTVERWRELVAEAGRAIDVGRAPVPTTGVIELVVIAGVVAVFLLVDLCTSGLRLAAWAGVPLLALWSPSVLLYQPIPFGTFMMSAVGYLALLALSVAPPSQDAPERQRRVMVTVAGASATIAATLAIGPILTVMPGFGANPFPYLGSGSASSVQLTADLNMRADLGRQSSDVVLRYHADPQPVGPLRLRTLKTFDGERWGADDVNGALRPVSEGIVLWPEEVPAVERLGLTTLSVEVIALNEDHLPIPVLPSTMEVEEGWGYDAVLDEVVGDGRTTRGMRYTLEVERLLITSKQLRAIPAAYAPELAEYLQVPASAHIAQVEAKAREVTATAKTPYDQALALQQWLRGPEFTYSTNVPSAKTGDALYDFIQDGTGYCVQFATAMTVMARQLGIPTRLAVGYLPGNPVKGAEGLYEITGDRAHAWPELYFPGMGWVRFEPTPGGQSGIPPSYADPLYNPDVIPSREPEIPNATNAPSQGSTQAPNVSRPRTVLRSVPVGGYVAGGAALVLLVVGTVLLARRRKTREPEQLTAETAWTHLRTRLEPIGVRWSDSHTPRQVIDVVTAQIEQGRGTPMDAKAARALHDLALSLERTRYAPSPPEAVASVLEDDVALVVQAASTGDGPATPGKGASARADTRRRS